jgi:hypothetical protein
VWDAELAIWLTPDPAAQLNDPYSMGGDPINFYDPTGLWKVGLGISFGWSYKGGFTLGTGLGIEDMDLGFVKVNTYAGADYNFNDGSRTYSAGVGGRIDIGVDVGGYLGAAYNTKSGTTLSYGAEAGIGGVGVGVGGGQYWNTDGDYLGSTAYAQTFAGAFGARAYTGYEWGFGKVQGRGSYVGAGSNGLFVEYAQNGGLNFGGKGNIAEYGLANDGPKNKYSYLKLAGKEWKYDHINRNGNQPNFRTQKEFIEYGLVNGMDMGAYADWQSAEHKPNVNEKLWMKNGSRSGWWDIPPIEGVFNRSTGATDPGSASYNYGNNIASHAGLDYLPWIFFDVCKF